MARVMCRAMQRIRRGESRHKQHRNAQKCRDRNGIGVGSDLGQRSCRHIISPRRHTRRLLITFSLGWSPGSRVDALRSLPGIATSGVERALTAYSRGGGFGFGPQFGSSRSKFPVSPRPLCVTFREPCPVN
jgi:hypothetical protein